MARKVAPGPLPEEHVRKLARRLIDGQLSLFVGAGLSHLAPAKDGSAHRLPLWGGLTEQVARACDEDGGAFANDPLDLFDAIVYGQERGRLEGAVASALDDGPFELAPAHAALGELPWRAVVTTNYDGLLQRLLGEEPVTCEEDYDRRSVPEDGQPRLFQIHGTRARPHTLTREDYRLWEEKHPRAARHLHELLERGTFLFVGYSLSDPHLDATLARVRQLTRGREKRLYAWMWRYPEQKIRLLDRRDKIEAISIEAEKDWDAAFRQVAGALEDLQQTEAPAPAPPGADPFAYDRDQYLQAVRTRFGVANLQGLYVWGAGYARDDVTLGEVFVEPDLLRKDPRPTSADESGDAETLRDLRQLRERLEADPKPSVNRIPAFTLFRQEPRVLVVGAPGQGKSTLLRSWLLSATERWAGDPAAHPFPFLVRLADWEKKAAEGTTGLIDLVREGIPTLAEISSRAAEAWLVGPVLWLLDGIDEVRDRYERERLREEVLAAAAQRPGDRWIVSTRPAGEPAGGWAAGWARTELPSLTDRQIEAVLTAWGRVLETKEGLAVDTVDLARSLQKDPSLRGLRGNALLLTLAVLFYKARRRLPRDRWEFFDVAEQVLRDSWVHHRVRGAAKHLPGTYLPALLERLALVGMEDGVVLFSRKRLEKETADLLTARGYSGADRDREVARFLRAAEDLIGVLVAQGPDQFGFLHLTFQEFLAARALVNRSAKARGYVARYWDHPDWKQVWVLYALGTQADLDRADELHRTILASGQDLDGVLERPRLKSLELAGVVSGALPAEAQGTVNWAVERSREESQRSLCMRTWKVFADWERAVPEAVIKSVLAALMNQEEEVWFSMIDLLGSLSSEPPVLEALLSRLGHENHTVSWISSEALASAVWDPTARRAVLRRLDDENSQVRASAARALSSATSDQAVRNALLGRLDDKSVGAKSTAATALVSVASEPEVREAFLNRLGDSIVGSTAATGLSSLASDPEIRSILVRNLEDSDPTLRGNSIKALGSAAADPTLRQTFLTWLGDEHYEVRSAAVRALGYSACEPEVTQVLIDCLKGDLKVKGPSTRWIAALALSSVAGDPRVRDALVEALANEEATNRPFVARALAPVVSEPRVREALLRQLEVEEPNVRVDVASILGSDLPDTAVREALLGRLGDPHPWVRGTAVEALASVASEPVVQEALILLLDDEDLSVQLAAAHALERGIERERLAPQ